MYEDDKRLKEIIEKYETYYDVTIETVEKEEIDFYSPSGKRMVAHTQVKAKNFEYIKNW